MGTDGRHLDEHPNLQRARFEALARDELMEPLRRYLLRRTDPGTVDDVLADTLLVCWRRFPDMPEPALPWAYGVARHCLANELRGARRRERLAARAAKVDPPQHRDAEDGPRDETLHVALARIPEADAELLRLWAWERLSPSEIAAVLEISANAASIRLHRARKKLRDELRKVEAAGGHEQEEGGTAG